MNWIIDPAERRAVLPDDGADARRRPAQHVRVPAAERRAALSGDPAPHALRHRGGRRARINRCDHAWLPNPAEPMRGSILRGWRNIVAHGYAAVYQDCRGRHGSEGEDRVYADDAADGYDTLEWIAAQPWCNGRSACRARRPARRRPSPPPRPGTRACARFSPRPAAPASMTMSSTRASRSRWSGCGCGWRRTSLASRPRTARP